MTDERLKFIAKQCLAMGKTELRTKGGIHAILGSYFEGHGLHRMRSVERLIVELAGEDWLGSAWKKARAFGILCYANSVMHPAAVGFVSVVDKWEGNAAFLALPPEEKDRVYHENPKNPQYFFPRDHLMASVQSPERLCLCLQRLQMPGALLVGEPEVHFWDQAEFDGNLKMYGEPPADIVEAMKRAPPEMAEYLEREWRRKQ